MCRNRHRSASRTVELHAVSARRVVQLVGDVDDATALNAVTHAAVGYRQARWLADALEDPSVFTGSDAPTVVDRLVAALTAAGVEAFRRRSVGCAADRPG